MKVADIENLLIRLSKRMTKNNNDLLNDAIVNKPEDAVEDKWADLIMRASSICEKKVGKEKAIDLLMDSYNEYKKCYPNSFSNKASILKRMCFLQMAVGQMKDAHHSMNGILSNALSQVKFTAPGASMRYFSFRAITDYSVKEIENEEISLAHPRVFNDPLDTILLLWLNNEINKESLTHSDRNFRLLMKKASEHIKLRCFIGSQYKRGGRIIDRNIEDLSVLMWSHYANNHKGMCIEYEFDNSIFKSGTDTNDEEVVMMAPIEYTDVITINDEPSMKQALFQKSQFWKYEQETRLCSFNANNTDEYPTIGCPGAIKAVYLGVNCKDADRRRVEIAIGDKEIPLYQMSIDQNKLTCFKKNQIG